jgi:periplasmic protein TonB
VSRLVAILFFVMCWGTDVHAKDWGEVQGWTIFESDDGTYCAMTMDYEGKGSTTLTFAKQLDDGIFIMASNYGWSATKDIFYDISLAFDASSYDVKSLGVGKDYEKRGFGISLNPESGRKITAELTKASGIRIYLGDTLVDNLSLQGSGAAISRVNACLANFRRLAAAKAQEKARWDHIPDDPFAEASPTLTQPISKARLAAVKWGNIYSTDYPSYALHAGIGGKVTVVFTVNEFSQPTKCKIIQSSGNRKLDDDTCLIAAKRFSFESALDAAGKAIEGTVEKTITWNPPAPDPPAAPPLEIQRE